MIDSEEDPESQKTLKKDETSQSTYLRAVDSGVDSELHTVLGASSTDSLTENATWWSSVVTSTEKSSGSIQDGGIHVPARVVILREDEEKKKKKRRGKPQKRLTGNQREKKRREKQGEGALYEYVPDWD